MDRVHKVLSAISALSAVSSILLAFVIVYDILMRAVFASGSVALQELQWHLFDVIFLLGLAYALRTDSHVRVDLLFHKLTPNSRAIVDLFSMLLAVFPFSIWMVWVSYDMAYQSYLQGEVSADPGGLGARWVVKSVLVLGFGLLAIESLIKAYESYRSIYHKKPLGIAVIVVSLTATAIGTGWALDIAYPVDPIYLLILTVFLGLFAGVPVAFVFGAVAMLFAVIDDTLGLSVLEMLPYRTYGIMTNTTLMAVPLFILMGSILQKANVGEDLIYSLAKVFGPLPGGIAVAVVVVGALMGAMTGIVGASVVMMTLIALPLMVRHRYDPGLAGGSIASSGTLGQIIPPSVVLIVLADQMHISVGDLFKAAIVPSFLLIGSYIVYIVSTALITPKRAPSIPHTQPYAIAVTEALKVSVAPLLLIMVVLGSIFTGVASPTESAGIGVVGAMFLAFKKTNKGFEIIKSAGFETVKLSAMIFMILIGATAFSLVFTELGGSDAVHRFFTDSIGSVWGFVLVSMAVIFILGFFVDFIEIAFVVVPILVPISAMMGVDPIWFAILIALNLQTSFLTPPFGFSLFYIKGASGDMLSTLTLYRGVLPFIGLQMIVLVVIALFPDLVRLTL